MVIEWLSPVDPNKSRESISQTRINGSGAWFLKGNAFRDWLRAESSSSFWLNGISMCFFFFLNFYTGQYVIFVWNLTLLCPSKFSRYRDLPALAPNRSDLFKNLFFNFETSISSDCIFTCCCLIFWNNVSPWG